MAYAKTNEKGIPVFRPTFEQFKDFAKYVEYMESQGAHKAGLAKVIPPPEWVPRKKDYNLDDLNLVIPAPICQVVNGKQGHYQQINIKKKAMTVKEYSELATSPRYYTPRHFDYVDLERKYWKNITYTAPIYGADVSGSLIDSNVKEWNINHLGTILDYVNKDYGISIDGVNTAYLYFGMWKTTFAWHTEDMDLYSINYLHFGAPKTWYVIPPEHGRRFERLASGFFPESHRICRAFLRHKMILISPQILKQHSIPCNKITQEAGEIMITFPYGYHAGFNHGFNCAESTNFATPRWVEYGKRVTQCTCSEDMVKISMNTFVKRFQPERYELWLRGEDIGPHPEDPRQTAASMPSQMDLLCSNNSDGKLPQSYLNAAPKNKRHMIHGKKKIIANPGINVEDIMNHADIPADVKKVNDLEYEEIEDAPDEQQMEVLKDIWLKAGEIEIDEASVYDDSYNCKKSRKRKRKQNANKERKPESASKFKKEAKVYIQDDGYTIKIKIKTKLEEDMVFVDTSQENSDEFLVPQGNYNDSIIIENDPVDDPLKPEDDTLKLENNNLKLENDTLKLENNITKFENPAKRKRTQKLKSSDMIFPIHIYDMILPNIPNSDLLKAFNNYWSAQISHCAVCATFALCSSGSNRMMPPDWKYCESIDLPENSPIWVSSSIFAANSKEQTVEPENNKLLRCRECHVTVHASCYGITILPTDIRNWACDGCKAGKNDVMCCLCPMFGGALKRTSDSRWAHILCMLMVPGVTFKDAINKDLINVLTINTDTCHKRCCFCGLDDGACLTCNQCTKAFHPSCGLVAGATFIIPVYNSQELQVTCNEHNKGKEKVLQIRQGEIVWAKHRNRRYYQGKVQSIQDILFYMVTFSDKSFSDDLYPSDITNYDPGNTPALGAAVTVNWTDGQTYDGVFEGTNHRIMFTVIFEDGSQLVLKRNEIHSLQDLPKRVRSRLSVATEMKHRSHLYGSADEAKA